MNYDAIRKAKTKTQPDVTQDKQWAELEAYIKNLESEKQTFETQLADKDLEITRLNVQLNALQNDIQAQAIQIQDLTGVAMMRGVSIDE